MNLEQFETVEFQAQLKVASSWAVFVRILEKSQEFRKLTDNVKIPSVAVEKLTERIEFLLKQKIDLEHANPHDVSITILLWALYKISPTAAYPISRKVIAEGQNLFWPTMCDWKLPSKIYDIN